MSWEQLFSPEIAVFAVAVVAIIVGPIVAIVYGLMRHRERMAMIEQGMHPDHPPDEDEGEGGPAKEL